MSAANRCTALLGTLLLAGTAWGNCTDNERTEMHRLGLDAGVIAYTCEEEIEIVEEELPVSTQRIPEETEFLNQTIINEMDYRQQISIGVGIASGSYTNLGPKTSLNGTALSVQYHWVESVGYTLGLQWLLIEVAGGTSATDEVRYRQQALALTAGWLLIDRPTLILAPELVLGIWGSGHLTDSVENARAQPSLNGIEIPVSIRIDDSLHVGVEYAWYDLSTVTLPESGIDISYPGSTGKARLEQSFRFYSTYRF
jgi:hypothetical protein